MKRMCLTVLLLITIAFGSLATVNMQEARSDLPIQVQSLRHEDNAIIMNLNIVNPEWAIVGDENQPADIAEILNAGFLEEEGMPYVPTTGRMFRLPPTGGVRVEIIDADYEIVDNVDYATFQNSPDPENMQRAQLMEDSWYPAEIASVADPAIFHDFRISKLQIAPVQVNTGRREARVYSNIQVRLVFEGEDHRAELEHWPTRISETFLPWYKLFLDWNDNELDEYTLYRGQVQVVIRADPPNDPLWEALEPWIEWKEQKGWDLQFITEDNLNSFSYQNIHSELQDRWEEEPFDYIVLIGDSQQNAPTFGIPPGPTFNYGDFYYSLMTDGDILPDVCVGRISVTSAAQLTNYVQKVFSYERDPYMEETDWYLRGAVLGVSHYAGISTYSVGHYWRYEMFNIGYTQVDTNFVVNRNTAPTIASMNEGISMFNFRGGVGDGLNINEISALSNTNKLFVACDVTCGTGDWSSGEDSQSERYMRAGTANQPKGGIVGMGTATHVTNTGRNNALSGGLAFSMLRQRNKTTGQGHFGAWLNLYTNYFDNQQNYYREFCEKFNLMGDPLVWIWTAIPAPLTVEHPEEIELGTNSFTVTVESDGEPLADAWVTLYKIDDDEEIIAKGVTGEDGTIILNPELRFTGTAMLTITAQNYHPYRQEIEVVEPDARIGYLEIVYRDDGENGTVGNDNGIPEAGETVGLAITAKNWGNNEATEVTASAAVDDPWITNLEGTVDFGAINANDTALGDGLILLEIAPEAQNEWISHISLTFTTSDDEYTDDLAMTIAAPQFALVRIDGANNFDPGENTTIQIRLLNVGGSDAQSGTGTLVSLDPFLTVPEPTANFSAMNVGVQRSSSNFRIAAHPETFPGYIASARLIVVTQSGQRDSLLVSFTIGTKSSSDPIGPDRFGYFAFDNTDTGYDLAPDYDWLEINPDAPGNDYDGDELALNDIGNNGDQTVEVDLPFTVEYYGNEFDVMEVSSNGWIAMGRPGYFRDMRNYWIPSPLGPPNMIAPYWDERTTPGDAGVFYYYDEPNGRFIVEWYRTADRYGNQGNSACTFQAVFFDQVEGHFTYTGDNEILFQYGPCQHTTGPTGGHGDVEYFTTGIENEAQDDGILYSYWNNPAPGAAAVNDGRAILFTTNVRLITGEIDGHVYRYESDEPVVGAVVRTSDYVFTAETDEDGYFLMEEVVIGVHDLVVEAVGFNPSFADSIVVNEDEVTTVDFQGEGTPGEEGDRAGMRHPEFNCDTQEINLEIPPESQDETSLHLWNTGNGPLDFAFRVLFVDPEGGVAADQGGGLGELDDPWDHYNTFDLTDQETRNRGVTFMNREWWVSGSNNSDAGINKFYRYTKEGELLGIYDQPINNHSSAGIYGLTTDGQYLYGADRGRLYQMEFNGDEVVLVNNWRTPLNIIRFVTYDTDRDWIWFGHNNADNDLYAIDLNGDVVAQQEQDLNAYGLGYYPDDPDGCTLYFMCTADNETNYLIRKRNPDTGATYEVVMFPEPGVALGSTITNNYNPLIWTYASVMDEGGQDRVQIWEMDLNTRWINIEPEFGLIEPEAEPNQVDITIFTTAMVPDNYYAWLEISHNSIEQQYYIPLVIEVTGGQPDQHFQPVEATGRPYAIIVDDASVNDIPVVSWDEIGIFDGDLCVGAEVVTEDWPLAIVAWEGDQAQQIPGFTAGDPISYKIWTFADDTEYTAFAQYSVGDGTFGMGPMSQVTLTAGGAGAMIDIPLQADYFELISSNVVPEDLDAASVFGQLENLAIAYQDDGGIYLPPELNTIGDITMTEGYQVFNTEADQLHIEGTWVDPQIVVDLQTARWNWMAYPLQTAIPVETALSPILDHLVIIQNDDGGFFIPGMINTIGNLEPGTGYFTFVDEDLTFQYNQETLAASSSSIPFATLPKTDDSPRATGLPYVILVTMDEQLHSQNPVAVEVYDGSLLVGKSYVTDEFDFTPVVAWGGSESQDLVGFVNGHEIRVQVLTADGSVLATAIESDAAKFGENGYSAIHLDASILPSEFAVDQGYPNPFNPSVTVPFALPQAGEVSMAVFNLLGQQVFSQTQNYEAGYHSLVFDASSVGRELVSGMYFLQVRFQGQLNTQKLMLLK